MAKKIQMMSHDKEWQVVDGVETLVPVEQFDIDPITDSSCVKIEGFRTLEETLNEKNMFTPEVNTTKVMDKVGGEYHQNVVDGAYEEAILYGNTQVNLCEEDTSVALQIPTTFTSFNNGELQINNKENQVVAPLIKGVTMVNLAQTNSASITSGNATVIQNVKGNTVYTLSFTFTTKNTNSGVTIQCYDSNGTFIENTMHKAILGDVANFKFTTHANAAKIHICNNAAYGGETIQLDEIMLIEGDQTGLDIPFFKGMKSVELVRPLTNLFTDTTPSILGGVTVTNSNGTVVATSVAIDRYRSVQYKPEFKANTDYVVIWDTLTYTHTATSDDTVCICKNDTVITNPVITPFTFKNRSIKFNTGSEPSAITLRIHATLNNTETGATTVTGLRVFEYDDYLRSVDLQSIGWFSGTKNVAVEPIKTCSKNLYPYGDVSFTSEFADSWCDAKGNRDMYEDIAQKSKSRFLLKKGIYYYSCGSATNISALQIVDDKEKVVANESGKSFTLNDDTYLTLRVKTIQANVATTVTNIQIERGETVTDYVAHDSRYYEPDGQNAIVLRSLPNGVCDTFNLQTGEYIQRINEVVFDGSEDENWNAVTISPWTENGYYAFEYLVQTSGLPTYDANNGIYAICDKFNSITYNVAKTDAIGILLYDSQGKKVAIKQKEYTTLDEWKQYLQQNPITVQYQLATPITTIIPRTIKRNNNGTTSTIDFKTYTNKENLRLPNNPSYLTINSMTSIKPVIEPITYIDFKTRLKANTDYSVIMDKDSTNKTINLGGTSKTYADRMLVRTPSINLEQNLRISGSSSIQNIMVIEGDVLDKELPYFNGMCNVKMPIVKNCGKNLFNFEEHKSNWWFQGGQDQVIKGDDTGTPYSVLIPISPLHYYKIQVDNWDRRYLVFLDANFNIISWEANVNITSLAPLNARYLLCYLNSKGISKEDNIMITASKDKNSNTISHEPYRGNDICIITKNEQDEIRLSQDMFEQGGISYPELSNNMNIRTYEQCKSDSSTRLRNKAIFKINSGKTYKLTLNDSTKRFQWYLWRKDGKNLGITGGWSSDSNTFIVTVPQTAVYMSLMFKKVDNSNITVNELNLDNFQLLELDSAIQLRSLPNGVKDELNLLTGEYIQRVGEVVFDGSDDEGWRIDDITSENSLYVDTQNLGTPETNPLSSYYRISDKFNSISHEEYLAGKEGIRYSSIPAICISKSKLNVANLEGFKQYLQQNPITVQYQLAEPIISYPRIVSNTQEREVGVKLPNGVCDTYNPSTGITVKRVGFIELDGSENVSLGTDGTYTNTTEFYIDKDLSAMKPKNNDSGILYCNKLTYAFSNNDMEHYYTVYNGGTLSKGRVVVFIQQSKLTSQDAAGLKTYLSQNPIKLWYELQTPITYQLTPYFGLPMPYAYKDGYLIMDSAYEGQTLPPEIKYKLLANRTGQITQNNVKLQNHTSKLSNLEAMLVEATLQSMYEREMMAFNLEMVNINLIKLEE